MSKKESCLLRISFTGAQQLDHINPSTVTFKCRAILTATVIYHPDSGEMMSTTTTILSRMSTSQKSSISLRMSSWLLLKYLSCKIHNSLNVVSAVHSPFGTGKSVSLAIGLFSRPYDLAPKQPLAPRVMTLITAQDNHPLLEVAKDACSAGGTEFVICVSEDFYHPKKSTHNSFRKKSAWRPSQIRKKSEMAKKDWGAMSVAW